MRHGPANAIDPALVAELGARLDEAERSCRPLVLTGSGRFFSAGLNLAELPPEREAMGAFVDAFDALVRRLFLFPCPTVAAVNGHAVAGGAILAAACDVRIGAAGSHRIGVSEVQLGVIFPATAFEVLRAAIPASRATEVLMRGTLTGPDDAVVNGFLHELAAPEDLTARAVARAENLGALPRHAYAHTKRELRTPFAERAQTQRAAKREGFLDTWFSEESKALRAAILGGPKAKAKP
jgi:enoyl-CoA hydratase